MLKLSANVSMLLNEYPLAERLARVAQAGFDAIEVQFPYSEQQTQWQQLLARHHLRCVLINAPAGDLMQGGAGLAGAPGREAEFARALQQACDWAQALNVEAVNILPGRLAADTTQEAALDTLAGNLALAASRLADIGVRCTFEAINRFDMPGFLIDRSHAMLSMQDRVNHPNLWLQYDLYHMARMGSELADELMALWPRIGHIQFADVPGRGAPGSGKLPFDTLFPLLQKLPYPFWCGAEYRMQGDTFIWKNFLSNI